ncbi:RNA polymerase sigma-70 factor [Algoriphagus lutimaris]|uniref:RNA polymerase sigma-70 factor n=1 Tax=Algoriphagus lutimaris TaxID=613197 RepID=UPI00293D89D7|nr:RNA polymerase sigma-70 factor [Algoriphagus lutimaris]
MHEQQNASMQTSDQMIFQSIKSGDEKALEMLFKEYYQPLCRYANSYLEDPADAEEVVQSCFIKLWEKRENISIQSSVKSYLYQIIRNACLNEIKHQKVKKNYGDMITQQGEQHSEASDQSTLKGELEEKIALALQSLPQQCRLIFTMSRFEELKYQEIADQLNLSIKTVENQMGKALKLMRTQLQEYLPLIALLLHIILE